MVCRVLWWFFAETFSNIDHEEEVQSLPPHTKSVKEQSESQEIISVDPARSSTENTSRSHGTVVHKADDAKTSDAYNGADRGHFRWSQSIHDLDVNIKVWDLAHLPVSLLGKIILVLLPLIGVNKWIRVIFLVPGT